MIDGTTSRPWDELPAGMRQAVIEAADSYGIELNNWQRTIVACMLLDPPDTTYVLTGGRKRISQHKTAAKVAHLGRTIADAPD